MAAFDFSAAQATASMTEGQHASVPTQSLLMQINADDVCLVRTQFQQQLHQPRRSAWIESVVPSLRRRHIGHRV